MEGAGDEHDGCQAICVDVMLGRSCCSTHNDLLLMERGKESGKTT